MTRGTRFRLSAPQAMSSPTTVCICRFRCARFELSTSRDSSRRYSIAKSSEARELLTTIRLALSDSPHPRLESAPSRGSAAHARGSERFGLVASSGAQRLKPHAVDVRVEVDPVHWFLNDRDDTRSSFYLEDAATEFQVQGLELDWVCVTWDADFRYAQTDWSYHSFVASRWHAMKKADRRNYLRNAYRVLLTRARQGMVIFVPHGNSEDATRVPQFYDATFEVLEGSGNHRDLEGPVKQPFGEPHRRHCCHQLAPVWNAFTRCVEQTRTLIARFRSTKRGGLQNRCVPAGA